MDQRSSAWLQTTGCPDCGAPAEVVARSVLASTDGPVEHVRVRCLDRHVFNLPVAMLADTLEAGGPAAADTARPSEVVEPDLRRAARRVV